MDYFKNYFKNFEEREEVDLLPTYKKKKKKNKIKFRIKRRKNYGEISKIFSKTFFPRDSDSTEACRPLSLEPTLVSINGGLIGDVG